ncbi:MAG: insulinase family protein [Bacteroidetes bacterium]|nr:insulinase family protein [Bacteroidota bacterium]MCL5266989.1 insulinase family protein [Bacteroidota bacterium]
MTYSTMATLDRSKPPKPGVSSKVMFPKYFEGKCDNGFKYFVVENHTLPIVTIGFVAKSGALFDGDLPGLGSVTSELLTKGTRKRTATQIAEEIDFVGGSLSSNVSWDSSQAFVSVLKHHLATGFGILQDVVLNPVFPEDEINRVKAQRLASIQQLKADPGYLADVRFLSSVFGDHPYGQPSSGTEKSVGKMTRRDFVNFHKTHYTPDNSFLVFAGDVNPQEAEKYVSKRFAKWRGKKRASKTLRAASEKDKGTVCVIDKPGAVQSALRVGHIGIARNSRDFLKVFVMNTLLGGYFSSRINMNLREVHGYTYGGKTSFDARLLPGVFEVSADVRNEVTSQTVDEILIELNKIRDTLPSKDEMTMVKNYLAGLFPIQLETPQQVAGRVIVIELYNLPRNYYRNYRDNILKVTAMDIQAVAKKYVRPDRLSIVLSGSSREIAGKLKKFGEVAVFDAEGNKISES